MKAASRRAAAPDNAVYVYALVQSARAPGLGKAPAGLPGAAKPRALQLAGDIWLVVADAPLDQYGAENIEVHLRDLDWVGARAVGHESVVEHLAKKHPTIPMKLFTLFANDARAVEQLRGDAKKLEHVFARIAGCAEWGVRIGFDELGARRKAQAEARAESSGASGTAFLLQKKKQKDAAVQLLGRAQREVDAVFDALTKLSRQSKRRPPGKAEIGARILLEAAFLVAEPARKKFEKSVAEHTRALAPTGYTVTLTGPWPAYNFVSESA